MSFAFFRVRLSPGLSLSHSVCVPSGADERRPHTHTEQLAVITQGIAARVAQGNASSAKAAQHAKIFPRLSELAIQHIRMFADGPGDNKAKL